MSKDTMRKWDLFVCHASEDKRDFVRPLVERLRKEQPDLRIWYDEFTMTLGDSLRERIDHGLANSRFGLVVLSPNFFRKSWPRKELDGLVAREERAKVILPIWHNISSDEVAKHSPILASRLAISTNEGLERITREILRALQGSAAPESTRQAFRRSNTRKALLIVALLALISGGFWVLPGVESWLSNMSGAQDPSPPSPASENADSDLTLSRSESLLKQGSDKSEPDTTKKKGGTRVVEAAVSSTPLPETASDLARTDTEENKTSHTRMAPMQVAPRVEDPAAHAGPLSVRFEYSTTGTRISAQAFLGDVLVGEATMIHLEYGKYFEVDEVHYALDGSGTIIYKARSRFGVQGGLKISEQRIYGVKVLQLFDSWG